MLNAVAGPLLNDGVILVDRPIGPENPKLVRIILEETIVPSRTTKLFGVTTIEKSGTIATLMWVVWMSEPD